VNVAPAVYHPASRAIESDPAVLWFRRMPKSILESICFRASFLIFTLRDLFLSLALVQSVSFRFPSRALFFMTTRLPSFLQTI
jgi:hypothetical protein